MHEKSQRRWATAVLVFGAVVFGMVLAGGVDWTPMGYAETMSERRAGAVRVPEPATPTAGFADLAEAVAPAVVTIRTVTFEDAGERQRGGNDPFEFFFGPRQRPQRPQAPEEFRSEAGGSGFLISGDGLIVTNNHVVDGATELMVSLSDDREYPAVVRGTDPDTDLALIQIEAGENLPHLALGQMDELRVGDWLMVIGNPLRLGRTVTVGVVSATGRTLGITDISFENFIQTDAAINFGNSGGPMVNMRGEVIGIATAINWGAENIGFGVPVSTLRQVLPQLEEDGRVSRGYLGVNIENIDFRTRQAFGLESNDGALVQQVTEDTPAAAAGLEHGDIILQVDDQPVTNTRDLIDHVASKRPGSSVELEILRDGKKIKRSATLGERPSAVGAPPPIEDDEEPSIEWLGLRYQELTPGLRGSHGIPDSVTGIWVQEIEPRSPLIEERIRPGDIISEVNGRSVDGVDEFEAAVEGVESGSFLRFYVQRFDPRGGPGAQFFAFVRKP